MNRYEPVGNTCPTIDSVIETIKDTIKANESIRDSTTDLQSFDEYEEEQIRFLGYISDESSNIENYLWSVESQMEELRSANEALRSWGTEAIYELESTETERDNFEGKVDELTEENQDLQNRIEELESQLEEYKLKTTC